MFYRVTLSGSGLSVQDDDGGGFLFTLSTDFISDLDSGAATNRLVQAFIQNLYALYQGAPISGEAGWEIQAGSGQPVPLAVNFPTMAIGKRPGALWVFGTTRMQLRDWTDYPGGVAFGGTLGLETALAPSVIGPSGLPLRWVGEGRITWADYLLPNRREAGG
jgi:hypothetical protein